MLIDTHCHIHEASYPLPVDEVLARAQQAGVAKMICVGTSQHSSREALAFAAQHDNVYAAIGVHPHETSDGWGEIKAMLLSSCRKEEANDGSDVENEPTPNLVAIGEIGLDYFYTHSPRDTQIAVLEAQLQLAHDHHLPVIFHVREAFADFWPIFDNFTGLRGVLHSFTDSTANCEAALARGLLVGVNGISTFTKDSTQQDMFRAIPLERMLLETDAPFLTPVPLRGKVNEPAFVRNVAEFHARERNISLEELAAVTSHNAAALFALL